MTYKKKNELAIKVAKERVLEVFGKEGDDLSFPITKAILDLFEQEFRKEMRRLKWKK